MLEKLRIFNTVYECKNFTRASELLFISQPTISLKMKQLEEALQVTLFIRQGAKSVQTTEQADILYEKAKNLLDDFELLKNSLHSEYEQRVPFTIACSNTFALYYVPQMLPRLLDVFPQLEIRIEMMNSEQAVQQVVRHEAHAALIEKPIATDGLFKQLLFQDELVLAGTSSTYWLMREATSGVHYFNALYLAEHNISPNFLYVNNTETLRKLVANGVGQSILPKVACEEIPHKPLSSQYKRNMYIVAPLTEKQHIVKQVREWLLTAFES